MPLDHLLAALERDGSAQAEGVIARARAMAETIVREADERVARRRGDVLDARRAELSGAAQTALGEMRRTGRRAVLAARHRLLDRVFAAARDMFPGVIATEAYRADALLRHLTEALDAVDEEPAEIHCPQALVPPVRAAVAGKKQLKVRGNPAAAPGIRVVTTDGAIAVDNTLEGRLERLRGRLALEVLATLEPPL